MVVYEPEYMFFYLLIVTITYLLSMIICLEKYKFNYIGYSFICLSIISCCVIFIYTIGSAYLSDTEALVFGTIGLLEVILFTHPYIFLILAVILGKKGESNTK